MTGSQSTLTIDSVSTDKQRFFTNTHPQTHLTSIQTQATLKPYAFLSINHDSLEDEFNHLSTILQRNDHNNDDLWLYCYYCSIMLATYYDTNHYNSPRDYAKYQTHAQNMEHYYRTGSFPPIIIKTLQARLSADLKDLLSTPRHVSKLRQWIGWANMERLAFTFARLSIQQLLVILQEGQLLEKISRITHVPLHIDEMNSRITQANPAFRALSVGFFATRLLINTGLLLKHTFFPTEGEKETQASLRFYQELKKRYATMLNDIVWAIINALTNYADLFKISSPVANTLMITGLIFDASLLAWRLHESEQTYRAKRKQYVSEKQEAQQRLYALASSDTVNNKQRMALMQRIQCLDEQLLELDIKQKGTRASFGVNLVAASILASAYTFSLAFAALPAAVFCSYFIIVVGVALYFSADAYGAYEEKRLRQNQLIPMNDHKALANAKADTQQAQNVFIKSMIKNTVLPILFMGVLAVSWQAALLVALLYLSISAACHYYTPAKAPTKAIPAPAMESPPSEQTMNMTPPMILGPS